MQAAIKIHKRQLMWQWLKTECSVMLLLCHEWDLDWTDHPWSFFLWCVWEDVQPPTNKDVCMSLREQPNSTKQNKQSTNYVHTRDVMTSAVGRWSVIFGYDELQNLNCKSTQTHQRLIESLHSECNGSRKPPLVQLKMPYWMCVHTIR